MKRLLLDTNIYGELILDAEYSRLKELISQKSVIHGFQPIRQELRDVPLSMKLNGKSLRISILHIYDELTKKFYPLSEEIQALAEKYYLAYRNLGGNRGHPAMITDCAIVACATIHQIDLVVSEDNKSMLSDAARKAYSVVNATEKKKESRFLGYLELKRWLYG